MDALPTPEILRTRLESVILNLKMLRIHDVAQFLRKLVSVPDDSVVQTSIALLKRFLSCRSADLFMLLIMLPQTFQTKRS